MSTVLPNGVGNLPISSRNVPKSDTDFQIMGKPMSSVSEVRTPIEGACPVKRAGSVQASLLADDRYFMPKVGSQVPHRRVEIAWRGTRRRVEADELDAHCQADWSRPSMAKKNVVPVWPRWTQSLPLKRRLMLCRIWQRCARRQAERGSHDAYWADRIVPELEGCNDNSDGWPEVPFS